MRNPVCTADGQCYEHSAINRWFESKKSPFTSPLTGQRLPTPRVTPNIALKAAMDEWIDSCGWLDVLVFGSDRDTRFWTVDRKALTRLQKLEHFVNVLDPSEAKPPLSPLPPLMKSVGTQTAVEDRVYTYVYNARRRRPSGTRCHHDEKWQWRENVDTNRLNMSKIFNPFLGRPSLLLAGRF